MIELEAERGGCHERGPCTGEAGLGGHRDEDVTDAGGAAGGAALLALGVGNIASGILSSRSSSGRGMLEASPQWASKSTAPMTRGAGDTRRKEPCLRPAGIEKN